MISITIIINFKKKNMKLLTQQIRKNNKIRISILILSLRGIPPLIGFIPK
jgi:NADH:ubiquinone oxidoreductase subunit 2 (subunit N)